MQAYFKNAAGQIVASGVNHYLLTDTSQCMIGSNCIGSANEAKLTTSYGPQIAGVANNLLPIANTISAGDNSLSATTTLSYDNVGNQTAVDGPLPGSTDRVVLRYDAVRQLVGVVGPDPDGVAGQGQPPVAKRTTYDPNGLVTQTEVGNVADQTSAAWNGFTSLQQNLVTRDAAGRPVKAEAKVGGATYAMEVQSYDALGRPDCKAVRMDPLQWDSQTDPCIPQSTGPAGPDRIDRIAYDPADQVQTISSAYGITAASVETMTYSANGPLTAVKDAEANLTTYEYDGHDRLDRTRYPVSTQGVNSSSTTDYQQLTYDPAGRVTQRRLRDGLTIGYTYDALGRLTAKNLPGADPDATYTYDLLGRLTAMTNSHAFSFSYDAIGQLKSHTTPQGIITYGYDTAGRRLTMGYPGGALTVHYDYDVAGNMTAIRENGATSGVGVLASYAYDSLGRRSSVTLGNGSIKGYSYDPASRLASLTADLGGTVNDLTRTFAYNPAGQIASVTGSNDIYAWTGHYNVDRPYTVNGLNQATQSGAVALGYDANGNLASSGSDSFGYTSENRLKSAPGGVIVEYDPLGRLFRAGIPGTVTRHQYDGTDRIAEYAPGNIAIRRFVHGPGTDEPIVWYEGAGLTDRRFLMADERGSVVSVTDSGGALIAVNRYDEFGIPAATNLGKFGYTGQAWVPELGIWYYKARMYSPTLGRFMQTDPIGYGDGMNWYNYVGSDPVNRIDPSGLLGEIVVEGKPPKNPFALDDSDRWRWRNIYQRHCDRSVMGFADVLDNECGGTNIAVGDLPKISGNAMGSKVNSPSLCDHRNWHVLKVAEKVAALKAAGFGVASNVSLSLIAPNGQGYNGPGWAVADYIAFRQVGNIRTYYIGEVKTGDGALTTRQMQHYGSGFAQIRGFNGLPIGLAPGEIFPVLFNGIDRFPGCPSKK